jgi:hypothetical protein
VPEYLDSVARAGRYGAAVLLLLLVTAIVAIWKPMWPKLRGKRENQSTVAQTS